MGAGRDGAPVTDQVLRRKWSLKNFGSVKDDLVVLRHIWFSRATGDDHAARLEHFYGPQAAAYDNFRSKFLWARKPMLAACAARLADRSDLVWVDLGGGTGENVELMSKYIPLSKFKAIYVVDLCHSLCEQAKAKVKAKGWANVHVIEHDACTFRPAESPASLITFSYSLSMIPPFHDAVETASSYLAKDGFVGVADFFTSARYDQPMRQMSWARRFFWRCIFDTDNIDIGPERRAYLEHKFERVFEYNSQGSIPYVPYLRAPNYVWVGKWAKSSSALTHEVPVEAPPLFPPTFLYTQSWEDPDVDMQYMNINSEDVCLTLTSGGCNGLNLILEGAKHVVSVDCNPAQSSLLELKAVAIRHLPHEDVWLMFGEGRHPRFEELFEKKLAPFLSQTAIQFWSTRQWYFKQGLYYQGGMGKACWVLQCVAYWLGLQRTIRRFCNASTLQEQRALWDAFALVRFLKHGPAFLVTLFVRVVAWLLFNRTLLWFGAGVPCKQYDLIAKDGRDIAQYIGRTLDSVAENSHLKGENYFYYNCLTGHFLRDNCPAYLKPDGFRALKEGGGIDRLSISSAFFMDELKARKFSKVILMDHADWLGDQYAKDLAATLAQQVVPGGIVIWRSASMRPPYNPIIAAAGFDVKCIHTASDGYMDRVNMYSSFFVATRKAHSD